MLLTTRVFPAEAIPVYSKLVPSNFLNRLNWNELNQSFETQEKRCFAPRELSILSEKAAARFNIQMEC